MKTGGLARKISLVTPFIALGIIAPLAPACVGDDPSTSSSGDDSGNDGGGDAPITNGDGAVEACSGTMCGTSCVDLKSDPNNCGKCGTSCKSDAGIGFACVNSVCGNKVVQVSAGFTVSCALLLDGSVWCWGGDGEGATGTISPPTTPVPQKVGGISNVVEVFAGWATVCARDINGDVWCWGEDNLGQTGQPIDVDAGELSPTPKKVALPEKAAQLTGNTGTMCARTVGGNVFCWGQNASDVLGLGADVTQTSPTPVQIPVFNNDATDVHIGIADTGNTGIHALGCGVRSNKAIWCWGSNIHGELGHTIGGGSPADIGCTGTTSGYSCNPIPQAVGDVDAGTFGDALKVQTRNAGACALRGDGTVWCWGTNGDGELGNGTIDTGADFVPALAMTNGAQMSAADLSMVVVDTGGHVHAWGATFDGVLPIGTYTATGCFYGFDCEESPVAVPLLAGIAQISLSFDHGLALTTSGDILAWGNNNYDDLGHVAGSAAGDAGVDTTCPAPGSGDCNPTPGPLTTIPWQ